MAEFIAPIERLAEEFRRIPGVGRKTAVRYAFAVMKLSEEIGYYLAERLGIQTFVDILYCIVDIFLRGRNTPFIVSEIIGHNLFVLRLQN